ncbi:MAG: winged helix-turn-helix transcriptional regulator [Clostridia bacterium]|nr:winged helix-turn-helix transcriptional regulator [Clostridia bacterium]
MKRTSLCGKEKEHDITAARAKEQVLSEREIEKMGGVYRMLADPTRLKILLGLMQGEMCVYHLTEVCGGTQSGVSHQLRVLRDNKVVKAKRLGQTVEYSIADGHIREMIELGIKHLSCDEV